MIQLINEQKLKIFAARNSINPVPYRSIEAAMGIDHSTIHAMLPSIEFEIRNGLEPTIDDPKKFLVRTVLSMAMIGQMSSRGIEQAIESIFDQRVSHDTILEILNYSGEVGREINLKQLDLSNVGPASFDEMFQSSIPLLGFVDNISAAILFKKAGDRTAASWSEFLDILIQLGLNPSSTITDGGMGLKASLEAKFGKSIVSVLDLFHILKKLREAKNKMEGICYSLIIKVDQKKKDKVDKRTKSFIEAVRKMDFGIDIFDAYERLLGKLSRHVYLGDDSGEYISSQILKVELKELAVLLRTFYSDVRIHRKVNDARSYIENNIEKIVAYKTQIEKEIMEKYPLQYESIMKSILPIIEYYDRYERSYENLKAQKYWAEKIIICKNEALKRFGIGLFNKILNDIDKIVNKYAKSNSLVENVNNQIRRFLDTYKSVPSWFCDLYSFYWNFHRFGRGKRKGFAPIELLTGKQLKKNWLELIIEKFPYHKIHSKLIF